MASYRWPITRRSDLSELPAVKHSDRPCLLSRNTAFHNSQHNGVARIVQSCSVPSYPGPDLLLAGPRFRKKCGAPNIRIPSYFHRNPQHHRTITSDAARMTDNYINTKDSWVTVTSLRSYCTKIHTNSIIYIVYCKLYLLAYCADYNIYDTSTVISMRFVRCNNKDILSVSQCPSVNESLISQSIRQWKIISVYSHGGRLLRCIYSDLCLHGSALCISALIQVLELCSH